MKPACVDWMSNDVIANRLSETQATKNAQLTFVSGLSKKTTRPTTR